MEITHDGNVLTVIPAKGELEASEHAKDDAVDAVAKRIGASKLEEIKCIADHIKSSVLTRITEEVTALQSNGETIDIIRIDGRNMMFGGSSGFGTLMLLEKAIEAKIQIHGLPEQSLEQVKLKRFHTVPGLEFEQFADTNS
ncbi:MAG: hypothetical protein HOG89_00565 [Candidatus Peribacter sp.]|jgi:hypothetical protein|nr:hypothetical protein [Candidatus Peribacter sp.]MBT4392982.1 hypothetical protein [Candidatus Peribacter sp.]MBT4601042.1 hypothetical protein [Candidatus Peribacter sp.]MBT5149596.1 hypothetical protein [Candidatus Peribacter sp.]MBT5637470.1 hypothetical protein [Candidatus Peribacter sp.]